MGGPEAMATVSHALVDLLPFRSALSFASLQLLLGLETLQHLAMGLSRPRLVAVVEGWSLSRPHMIYTFPQS